MFNSTVRPAVASTAPNTTFTPLTTSQPFVFGAGTQNPPTTSPFGNLPANTAGTSVFGRNQSAPVAQPNNAFPWNATGTNVKANPIPGQGPFSVAPTTTNVFGFNNNAAATANPFNTVTPTVSNASGGPFNQPFPTAPQTASNLFTTGANIFGTPTAAVANPFNITTSTTPAKTSGPIATTATPFRTGTHIFGTQTAPAANTFATARVPFNANLFTGQPVSNITAGPNKSAPFQFVPQPVANTNLFPQTTIASAPMFPGFNPVVSTAGATNIFSVPVTSTTAVIPTANPWITQPTGSATLPFTYESRATSLSYNNGPSTTATAPIVNPPILTGSTVTGTQPAGLTQVPKPQQNTEQTVPINQQNFLAASLLDPYANPGRKHFTSADLIQAPTEFSVASTTCTTTNTTTITTSAPIPVTLSVQSNLRKASSSRSALDINFKLKPVSSSPTSQDDIKPVTQQTTASTGPVKSTLGGKFTDEEELILLSQTKMSKLRLSNDSPNASSQPNSLRSLYPVRRLAELEKFTTITPRPSSPTITTTTTVNHEQTSRPSNVSRDVSPNQRFTPPATPKQSSSPIIQRKSNDNDRQNYRLPNLTRDYYYMKPTQSELESLFNDQGHCILKQFTVGHEKYGSVTFYGHINVAGLDLDEIIEINRHEVVVYPDEDRKPAVGEGLNLPARITLFGVYPTDRATREEITDIERIKAANYTDHLRELTKKFDGEFINYGMADGSWTFMVKHFTRYGLDNDQENFLAQP